MSNLGLEKALAAKGIEFLRSEESVTAAYIGK